MTDITVPKPPLGQPGSGFEPSVYPGEIYYNRDRFDVKASEDHQILAAAALQYSIALKGSQELISSNLRTLSAKLSSEGIRVRAWSFFSGALPGAEMLYEAKDELEDVLYLSEFPSLLELLKVREQELIDAGVAIDYDRGGYNTVREAGLQEAYIIDDWDAFIREMRARDPLFSAEEVKEAHQAMDGLFLVHSSKIMFYFGGDPATRYYLDIGEILQLESYDGLRTFDLRGVDLVSEGVLQDSWGHLMSFGEPKEKPAPVGTMKLWLNQLLSRRG
jgi:hypothetical protein